MCDINECLRTSAADHTIKNNRKRWKIEDVYVYMFVSVCVCVRQNAQEMIVISTSHIAIL